MRCQGSSYKSSPRPSLLRYIRYLRSLGVPFLTIFQINPLQDPKIQSYLLSRVGPESPIERSDPILLNRNQKAILYSFDMAHRVKSKKNLFLAKAVRCQEEYSSKDSFTKLLVVETILVDATLYSEPFSKVMWC